MTKKRKEEANKSFCYCLGISHLSVKSLLVFSALLLSSSSAFADDDLYLKCEESWEADVLHAHTSKFIKEETKSYVGVYKIAIKGQTIQGIALGERESLKTYNVKIDDNQLTYSESSDIDNGKSSFQLTMNLDPPFSSATRGKFISNELPVIIDWKIEGVCKKVDASVFEKALKESKS